MLTRDHAAVQGLPLSMVIAMTIVLISAPLAFSVLQSFSEDSTRQDIERELWRLHDIAAVVYSSEPGGLASSLTYELSMNPASGVRIDSIRIGADLAGPNKHEAYFSEFTISGMSYVYIYRGQQIPLMVEETGMLKIEDVNSVEHHQLRLTLVDPDVQDDDTSPCNGGDDIDRRFVCIEVMG